MDSKGFRPAGFEYVTGVQKKTEPELTVLKPLLFIQTYYFFCCAECQVAK